MKRLSFPRALAIIGLAIFLAACSSGDKTGSPGALPSGAGSKSSSPKPSSSSTAPGTTGGKTTDRGPTLSGTPAPEPPEPGARAETAPPRPGLYRYEQDGESSIEFFAVDDEGTLEVDRAVVAKNGQRQKQTRTLSDNQQMEQVYLYTDDGVYLESATQRVYGQEVTCTFSKPLRILRLPLEVGTGWSGEGECEGIEVSFEASVARTEMRTVGSKRVQTFVIKSTYRADGENFSQKTTSTTWLSRDYRLVVRSTQKSSGTQGAFSFSSSMTEQLVSLTPK